MRILEPYYYELFNCIAQKCKDSCCKGWSVCIDKKTFLKYKKIGGDFGKEINRCIKRKRDSEYDGEYGEMILTREGKCLLLDDNNLCRLYINKGEKYLCRTCTVHPRLINQYGNWILERNLKLSCPVVAEFLINSKSKLEFIEKDEDISELDILGRVRWNGYEKRKFDVFWKSRNFFIDIAQFSEIPVWKRLLFIKIFKVKIEEIIEKSEYDKIDLMIDVLRKYATDISNIESLDNILISNTMFKYNTILKILKENINYSVYKNETFDRLIKSLVDFILKYKDKEKLERIEYEFNKNFKDKEYILENYLVYNLYANYMEAMYDLNIDKQINNLIVSYSIIKAFLISNWSKNNNLSDDDIIDILYCYTKIAEQDKKINIIYNFIKKEGYDINLLIN